MKIRFIPAGTVSGLRSQSIYHGLAYAQQADTPDTVILATPETPYMCIGFFQDPNLELDMDYCRSRQLPVIRRETGGGAVYIDEGQMFVQWVFQQSSLPGRVDKRFQLFIEPLVETYKFFGIDAYYHPINDVHVAGKKIVGTGAGTIGDAQVVTGNFLFDFDYLTMLKAVNVPSDAFRQAVADNLGDYLTTMKRELRELPTREEVIGVYREKCESSLGLKTELGSFTDRELREMEKVEAKFVREDWLYQSRAKPSEDKLLKIHLGVWIGEINRDVEEGKLNVLLTMKNDRIAAIKMAARGLDIPGDTLARLEGSLLGVEMDRKLIAQKVESALGNPYIEDWVDCIYAVKEMQLRQTGYGSLARSH